MFMNKRTKRDLSNKFQIKLYLEIISKLNFLPHKLVLRRIGNECINLRFSFSHSVNLTPDAPDTDILVQRAAVFTVSCFAKEPCPDGVRNIFSVLLGRLIVFCAYKAKLPGH